MRYIRLFSPSGGGKFSVSRAGDKVSLLELPTPRGRYAGGTFIKLYRSFPSFISNSRNITHLIAWLRRSLHPSGLFIYP